jgi:hypothetical protein
VITSLAVQASSDENHSQPRRWLVDFGAEITEGSGQRVAPFVAETFAFTEEPATGGESLAESAIELPPGTPTDELQTSSEVETSDEVKTSSEQATPFLAAAGAMAIAHGVDFGKESPEEDLSWLDELETTYGDLSENASEEQAYSRQVPSGPAQEAAEGLPEWLISGTVEGEQASEESLDEQSEIKPAELPSWLQAMRPVGVAAAAASVLGPDESQQIEGAGPLAGLRGALPAEPDISKVQKPPVYSVKLQVTDAQQLQAELLRGLIDSEDQAEAFTERSTMRSQKVMRC